MPGGGSVIPHKKKSKTVAEATVFSVLLTYKPSSVKIKRSPAVIYLECTLPYISSCFKTWREALTVLFALLRIGFTRTESVTRFPVGSYPAFSPLRTEVRCYFLLHCPGSCLRRTLSVILSRRGSDFPQGFRPATAQSAERGILSHYNTLLQKCQRTFFYFF